jgi:nucleotide-binding universal stress UspA family protein
VDLLSDYAERSDSDLIVVTSHSRSGLKRFFLGSFAETLLHRSKTPVLVVGPKNKFGSKLERIIFPCEFGAHSKALFRQVVSIAKQFNATILFLHVIPKPDPLENMTRRANAWVKWATHHDVKAEVRIEIESDSVINGILKASKENPMGSIIMMEAQSNPAKDNIMGSNTKKAVREARCPVWVYTSHYVAQAINRLAA